MQPSLEPLSACLYVELLWRWVNNWTPSAEETCHGERLSHAWHTTTPCFCYSSSSTALNRNLFPSSLSLSPFAVAVVTTHYSHVTQRDCQVRLPYQESPGGRTIHIAVEEALVRIARLHSLLPTGREVRETGVLSERERGKEALRPKR